MEAEYRLHQEPPGRFARRRLVSALLGTFQPDVRPRDAQLLSALLLIILAAIVIGLLSTVLVSSELPIFWVVGLILTIVYVLSRTKYYRTAVILTLLVLTLLPFVTVLAHGGVGEIVVRAHLVWLVLPVLMSSLFFSVRGTTFVIITICGGVLLFPLLTPGLPLDAVLGALGMLLTISGLVLVSIYYRSQEERQRGAALAQSENRYRGLFEDSPVAIWEEDFSPVKAFLDALRTAGVSDLAAYFGEHPQAVSHCAGLVRVLAVNQAAVSLYQAGSAEELCQGLQFVLADESLAVFREELLTLAEGNLRFESEIMQRTVSGTRLYAVLRLVVAPGHEEDWTKVLISIVDITERRQAEDALRENELRYRALFERTNDAVFLVGLDGVHLMANRQGSKLLGYTTDELVGMPIAQVVAPYEYYDSQDRLSALLAGEPLPVYERTFRHKDGHDIPVEINAALVSDAAGRPLHIQSIVRDISERKRTEAERERLFSDLLHRSTQLVTVTEISKSI
ncbi:MAG: PAS domain S-box protein, partial [Chloroflexi bacterium]|nr:PAS domain S-box protein [Chloroflexota bacterium]